MGKSSEKFLPGSESDKQFDQVLAVLKEGVASGIVDVKVDADGDVSFVVPAEVATLLRTKRRTELADEQILAVIEKEIPGLAAVSLAGRPETMLKRLLPDKLVKTKQGLDRMSRRARKVATELIVGAVRERILLRTATAGYAVGSVRWHHNTAQLVAQNDEKVNVPHICLELTFVKTGGKRVMVVMDPRTMGLGFVGKDDISVTLDFHKDDLADLIKKLQKIENSISE